MNNKISSLLKGRNHCSCGLNHQCNIDDIVIEKNAIYKLPSLLNEYKYKNIVLVSDYNTYEACGMRIYELLKAHGFKLVNMVFQREQMLIPNEKAIEELQGKVESDSDVIIGVGSGVINDLCKYVSFKLKLPYIITATAPSMDGYASIAAAMIIGNMKITYNTQVPRAIIADVEVLKKAPIDLIRAGYGDMLGKLSALNDWKLSNIITGEVFCDEIYNLIMALVKTSIYEVDKIMMLNEDGIQKLMEGLVIVGICMSYMGNSRPASGSEHHLSHFYELISIMKGSEYFLHGIDVAFSTALTCELRHRLMKAEPLEFAYSFDAKEWEKNIREVYAQAAEGVVSLQQSLGFYSDKNLSKIIAQWDKIKSVLSEVPSYSRMVVLIEASGLKMNDFFELYEKEMIEKSLLYAKDLKDRYTLLWLLHDLGMLEKYVSDNEKIKE